MGRQPRLVLLLLLATGAIQVSLSSTPHYLNIVHDEISDRDLASSEDVLVKSSSSSGIKISTPKVKELPSASTTSATSGGRSTVTTPRKPISDEVISDLLEASKHHSALANHLREGNILPQPVKKNDSAPSTNSNKLKHKSDENYDVEDEDYSYDYYEDYNPDENSSPEPTKKAKSTIKDTRKAAKRTEDAVSQLKPIKEEEKRIPKEEHLANEDDENNMNNNTDSFDEEDDYDEDDDDDEDDDENENENEEDANIADEEEIVFNENVPCPRDCICARNINSYLVATCSRLDLGKQKFGSDITDLVVTDVGPKYPILLGPDFFVKIGLKYVSTIKIANCTIEYLHQSAFHGLDALYSVNLTNVGLAIINPDTFANNKKLRLLTITGNDLSVMSSVHYLLKSSSLEEVDLSSNNLMELNPTAFSKLSNVVYINLSQNSLQKIPPGVFDTMETLEELDLSFNSLKTLPHNIFNRTALAILRLKYNEITGDLRFCTADLQQLDLSFNSIKQIHHGMFDKMEGLTNLILKGNGITKIQPDSFLTLKNLRNIDLSINEIDQVSSLLFFKNSELDVIRLNDNPRLSQLPTDGFQSNTGYFAVYFMDISNCAIGALGHKTFATMPRLATLKLSWNNINNLERDTFATLPKLNELDLSNNLIVKLDELMFMKNSELTKLNLAGNPIRKLSVRLFLPMNKLTHLDVSECELHSLLTDNQYGVGRKYKFYETLRSFNASANQIKKISSADVKNFKNLRTLDISYNPLKCNEEFQEFISYVSVNTHMIPNRDPPLENLESDVGLTDFRTQEGWVKLAREVCKHRANLPAAKSEEISDKRIEDVEQDLDEDAKKLLDIVENTKLKKMQNILESTSTHKVVVDNDQLDDESDGSSENDLNVGGEDKVIDDDEENVSDYDEDEDEEEEDGNSEEEDDDDYGSFDKKKAETVDLPKLPDHSINVEEIELSKGTKDTLLLNKFLRHGEESNNASEEGTEEIIIERGRIYYGGFRFLIPAIIVLTCMIIMLLAIAKIVTMVMRKRGERYRMALLASSKNSIVYQKLSEDIKAMEKQPKQPKVHRYSPINQV